MPTPTANLTPTQLDCLVAAVLATYSFSLEKAWALRDALRQQGLCDVAAVAAGSIDGVGNLLKKAGYDRGGITYIVSPRLIALAKAIQAGALAGLPGLVASGAKQDALALLQTVKGIGPKSAELAWELLAAGE